MKPDKEKMLKILDELKAMHIENERKVKDFIDNRQKTIIDEVYQTLQKHQCIDSEDILYSKDKFTFSEEEFSILFDLLIEYAKINNRFTKEPDGYFDCHNFYFTYKDLNITGRIAHGQGTMTQLRIDIPEIWQDKYSFTWEQYINNIDTKIVAKVVMTDGACGGGEPRIDGTRITVKNVLQQLAGGVTIQEICEDFCLEEEQVVTAIRWVIDDLDSRY